MSPSFSAAARRLPSALEATPAQLRPLADVPLVRSFHVTPKSVEVQISLVDTTAERWRPSALEAIELQYWRDPEVPVVRFIDVAP